MHASCVLVAHLLHFKENMNIGKGKENIGKGRGNMRKGRRT